MRDDLKNSLWEAMQSAVDGNVDMAAWTLEFVIESAIQEALAKHVLFAPAHMKDVLSD